MKYSVYSMALGNSGIIKVGYTNDLARRAGEHGRHYGCPKQVTILSAVTFTSKATAEAMETQLIKNCLAAGLQMVRDSQNGLTERFYMSDSVETIAVKGRKLTYEMRVRA